MSAMGQGSGTLAMEGVAELAARAVAPILSSFTRISKALILKKLKHTQRFRKSSWLPLVAAGEKPRAAALPDWARPYRATAWHSGLRTGRGVTRGDPRRAHAHRPARGHGAGPGPLQR